MSAFGLNAPAPAAPTLPGTAEVLAQAGRENFPVALWFLPAKVRYRLLAVYGFARLVDDVGDEGTGDVAAQLDWLEEDLARAATGSAVHPLLQRLTPLLIDLGLPLEPFGRLIEANRRDQQVSRYPTFEDLRAYCALSATPVGELVLGIFEVSTPERRAWSDDVCTAMQLVEHLQDLGEDARRGRVYLPAEDMARFGCPESDLLAPTASRELREVVAFETDRSRHLLQQAAPLARSLPVLPRLAIAGFAAGGLATVDALAEADYEVLAETRRPARRRVLFHLARLSAVRWGWTPMTLESAYQYCEEVTSREAKNFAYGIRLLRPPERRAMTAVYAMARRIDDITDGDLPPERKLEALAGVRKDLGGCDPTGHDPVLPALADAAERYPLPFDAFGDLIDGCEMDVTGTTYGTRDELVGYCRRVAGSIGRLSLAIFSSTDPEVAVSHADDLGVALQLTNILRDVIEDRGMERVYLPADDARSVGCPADLMADTEALARLVAYECPYAAGWFDRGLRLLPLLDRRSRACVSAMAGIYRRLLDRMAGDPIAVTQGRVSVPTWEKGWVAISSLTGFGR